MREIISFIIIGLGLFTLASCGETKKLELGNESAKEKLTDLKLSSGESAEKGLYAQMTTNRGEIIIKLFEDKAPLTVANFVGLAEGNLIAVDSIKFTKPYYNGLKFHRVISKANGQPQDFMIQGGDPAGNGSGGPGYKFFDETKPTDNFNRKGLLAMANAGPNTNGSQFFITIVPTPHLNGKHTIFGEVIEGQDIVDNTLQGDTIKKVDIYYVGTKFNATEVFQSQYTRIQKEMEAKELEMKKLKAQNDVRVDIAKSKSPEEYKSYFYEIVKEREPKAIQTETGLVYVIRKKGTGENPKAGDHVVLHYTGTHFYGEKFDSSVDRNIPFEIDYLVTGLIPGFNEGVGLSQKDMEIDIYVPYYLAYGINGRGPSMPPYSDLVFELKILDIQAK
ncbi:MAG: peptidylprolyl isomerase [Brumimicrobium sp.]